VTTSFIKYNFEINEGGANDSALIASWYWPCFDLWNHTTVSSVL
jgi:hypothetical protein